MRGLLVTGTDTDVGKTFIAAHILKLMRQQNLKIGAYKPVCSGAILQSDGQNLCDPVWADVEALSSSLSHEFPRDWICPQRFLHPLAPPVAAEMENRQVDDSLLTAGVMNWGGHVDGVVVEGVGGWKCPISATSTVEDFSRILGFPVLIVAAHKLGAINHTLLTVEAVRRAGLKVAGIVLNQISLNETVPIETNVLEILRFTDVPFLTIAQFGETAELRCQKTLASIDWWNVMERSATPWAASL